MILPPPPKTEDEDLNRWLMVLYESLKRQNSIYYLKTDYIDASAGAADAGKPIVLDSDGLIDASMIPSP